MECKRCQAPLQEAAGLQSIKVLEQAARGEVGMSPFRQKNWAHQKGPLCTQCLTDFDTNRIGSVQPR